jgi:hypothetical protein
VRCGTDGGGRDEHGETLTDAGDGPWWPEFGGGRKVTAANSASHGWRRRSRGPPTAGDGSLDAARHGETLDDDGLLQLCP